MKVGEGTGQTGGTCEFWSIEEVFSILIKEMVMQMYTFAKIHRTVHLKR